LREGRGVRGRRLLLGELILPPPGAWEIQAEDQLRPAAQWVSAAISQAINAEAGLLFVHSHPNPAFLATFSAVDNEAIISLAETVVPVIDGPFAAAVVHPSGWVGVVATDTGIAEIGRVWAVGRTLRALDPPELRVRRAGEEDLDARQRDALGDVHERLRGLRLGLVGVGGLGSPVAEQLVRMGVEEITIIDNDVLDTASNVRRVVGSTAADLLATVPPPKVDVVGRHLDQLGLGVRVRRLRGDVRREDVFRELLDTDVVLSGTDTHGSRAAVNDLASTYFLPVIDCGVRAGAKADGRLAALTTEIRVLTPVTPCLWCREAISSDVIRAENLPPEQRDQLAAEGYLVDGFGEPAPSVVALTFTAAGLMTSALIALLSKEGEVAPAGYIVDGLLGYVQESRPTEPRDGCLCRARLGMGDALPPPLLPRLSPEDSVSPLERGISSP
jgi:molybdopterin-synthase adenylyltransferase